MLKEFLMTSLIPSSSVPLSTSRGYLLTLTEREKLFIKTLCSYPHGHVAQDSLRFKLKNLGVPQNEFKEIKKRLLYSGVIGIVYGNITLEDETMCKKLEEE